MPNRKKEKKLLRTLRNGKVVKFDTVRGYVMVWKGGEKIYVCSMEGEEVTPIMFQLESDIPFKQQEQVEGIMEDAINSGYYLKDE